MRFPGTLTLCCITRALLTSIKDCSIFTRGILNNLPRITAKGKSRLMAFHTSEIKYLQHRYTQKCHHDSQYADQECQNNKHSEKAEGHWQERMDLAETGNGHLPDNVDHDCAYDGTDGSQCHKDTFFRFKYCFHIFHNYASRPPSISPSCTPLPLMKTWAGIRFLDSG